VDVILNHKTGWEESVPWNNTLLHCDLVSANVLKMLLHLVHMSSERSLIHCVQNKTPHNIYSLTQSNFFLAFVSRLKLFKNRTFRKPAVLPSSGNEAPNMADPLGQAILITGSTMLGASLPEDGIRTGF
jgi:hypothetical protein